MDKILERLMDDIPEGHGRREFIKTAGTGMAAAGALIAATGNAVPAQARTREEKMKRMASNCWSVRHLFKRRPMPPREGQRGNMSGEQRRRMEEYQREIERWK